jgi:hypothetical protein
LAAVGDGVAVIEMQRFLVIELHPESKGFEHFESRCVLSSRAGSLRWILTMRSGESDLVRFRKLRSCFL